MEKINFEWYRGDDEAETLVFESDGEPVDFTGCDFAMDIVPETNGSRGIRLSLSDGILTLGTNIGGAIVAVVFNDGSRACYKIAARVSGFSTLPRFRTNILHTGTEAVSGGTSKEELDQATRYEWGEDVVYPPVPSIEQFYTPQQVQVRLNDLEFDEEVDSQGDYRIANVSALLPEDLTENKALEIIKSMKPEKTNYRIKRPVITLTKGKEYKFKIKLNNPYAGRQRIRRFGRHGYRIGKRNGKRQRVRGCVPNRNWITRD